MEKMETLEEFYRKEKEVNDAIKDAGLSHHYSTKRLRELAEKDHEKKSEEYRIKMLDKLLGDFVNGRG